jgi:Sulfotransferase family
MITLLRRRDRSMAPGEPESGAAGPPGWLADYKALCEMRIAHLVPVHEPLVLISQIQRSGGTLLAQLFDSHPQCHAYPPEMGIGYPNLTTWPVFELTEPEQWFRRLSDKSAERRSRGGYSKIHKALKRTAPDQLEEAKVEEVFPFVFSRPLQQQLFDHCISSWDVTKRRDVLDAYFTSYFNAWLDNQNLYSRPKRVVTGFRPDLVDGKDNIDRFFADYPDGRLVSIVRDPKSWYASRRHERANFKPNVSKWITSVQRLIETQRQHGSRVFVLGFEDLIKRTEEVMSSLAELIGIDFYPTLLEPTFSGYPIKADSSYPVSEHGIIEEPLTRYKTVLPGTERRRINKRCGDLYEEALSLRSYGG